jgi:hypothetical protein
MGGSMASIVEWQALRMQEYRHRLLFGFGLVRLFEVFGVRRPVSLAPPIPAGPYDESAHVDHPDAPSALTRYFEPRAAAAEAAEPAPVEPAPVEPPAAEPRSQEAGPDAPSGRPPEPDGGEPDRE